MATYQSVELTATTSATGYLTYTFGSDYDKLIATVNSPQAGGTGNSVVSCAAQRTANRGATVRVWMTDANWSVQPAVSKQVTVTLLAITG